MNIAEKGFLFILSEDSPGGMAKYCKRLVLELQSHGFDASIIFLKEIIQIPSDKKSQIHRVVRFIKKEIQIYRTLKSSRATSVVAFQNGVVRLTLLPSKLLRMRFVISERSGPSVYFLTKARNTRFFTWLLYSFSDTIVVQFPRFIKRYPIFLRRKMIAIPNSVEIEDCTYAVKSSESRNITYLGRLSFEKNIDIIVEAFFRICLHEQDIRLQIVGSGPEENKIRSLVEKSPFRERVKIIPFTHSVCQVLVETNLLVQISKWEGFPNSVAEALAHGIPILGSEDCDGVTDLIQEGVNGHKVVGEVTVESVAEGLEFMLKRNDLYVRKSCKESIQNFSPQFVTLKWQYLLGDLG